MASKEYNKGYNDAIEQLRKMIRGGSSSLSNPSGGSGGGSMSQGKSGQQQNVGSDGTPMMTPQLNSQDQKKADKLNSGNSQASSSARKEAANAGTPMGGFISQEAGAEIARSEGYGKEDCEVKSSSELHKFWEEASIEACSKNNSPGLGNLVTKIRGLYLTKHDWKGELKKFIGRALSRYENNVKYGKRKWLAQDEIHRKYVASEGDLSDIIFMIDCSGSVSDDLLRRLMSECYTIVKKKGIDKVTYCFFDDGIQEVQSTEKVKEANKIPDVIVRKIKAGMAMHKDIHGRGGNNEERALKDMLKISGAEGKKDKIELLLWMSDGYTANVPARPREVKNMIWCVYDNPNFKASDDSRVIYLNSKDLG